MFCPNCGRELQKSETLCPICNPQSSAPKKKQSLYTYWPFWALIALAFIALTNPFSWGKAKVLPTPSPTPTSTPTETITPSETIVPTDTPRSFPEQNITTPKPVPTTEVTKQPFHGRVLDLKTYDLIKTGMTQKEFVKLLGYTPTITSDLDLGSQGRIIIYGISAPEAVKGKLGANALFTFQSGKLTSKAQYGLE